MVCHAPKHTSPDSFDAYCDHPKIQHLTREMAVGYECAICSKMASLKKEAEESSGVKRSENGHSKARSSDQVVTVKSYVEAEPSYLEDEIDAWQVGLRESVSPLRNGKGKENAKRDASVPRRGSRDDGGRSSSAARKGSKDSGRKRDSYTDKPDDGRPHSGTPYGGTRRSGNTMGG